MLSDARLRALKPRERPYKVYDGDGLYVEVPPRGRPRWRFRYRFEGRNKLLSFGTYPPVTLRKAREARDEARRLLVEGRDPSAHRKDLRRRQATVAERSFAAVAEAWLGERERHGLSARTMKRDRVRLRAHVLPALGALAIDGVTAADVRALVRGLAADGRYETARRVRALCSAVFRHAIEVGLIEDDPASGLPPITGAPVRHRAAVTGPAAIGALVRAIRGYDGAPVVRLALELLALTFVRPGELRGAEWAEFDFERAEWRLPAGRMKLREDHLVPLSRQALAVLAEARALTGRGRLVFPGLRSAHRPISDNALNAALRRLGYAKDEMTAHGFRAMASTALHELGFPSDAIERQLAHRPRNRVRAAYDRAAFVPERRRLMQMWADYLDALAAGDTVVPLSARAARMEGPRLG